MEINLSESEEKYEPSARQHSRRGPKDKQQINANNARSSDGDLSDGVASDGEGAPNFGLQQLNVVRNEQANKSAFA
jgi:hypothetical protein